MRFRKSTHALYKTEYHVVWTPRYHRKIFVTGVKEYADSLFTNFPNLHQDIEVVKVNVRLDHIHIILVIPPRIAVAEANQYLKSQSGKRLKAKFAFLNQVFWGRTGIWSRGYCVSTIGLNEKQILDYVTYQEKEDKGQLQFDLE
ncbi:IS200/IS605 family transposase [Candidatus Nomurabacteria bacterium]|nr:IS200/IS605 family transposase [Candidatus Kaiserbacteria bacterium]MCB9814865.1 IS200/IS605 family transposase [Candidatus Nomurabacteria bacterium]